MIEYYYKLYQYLPVEHTVMLVLAIFVLFLSVWQFKLNNSRGLVLLFFSSLILGVFFALIDPYLNIWDEQFHALVAKNLVNNPLHPKLIPISEVQYDYKSWVQNYTWLHKQPLSLWQIALSIKIFGTEVWAVRLPSVLMHAALVFPIFKMGKTIYNAKVGFAAAVIFSTLNFPLELVSGLHTAEHIDVAFLFYITFSIWAGVNYLSSKHIKWAITLGVFVGLAILSKWLVGLLAFGAWGLFMLFNASFRRNTLIWKHLFLALGIALLIALPWQIYAYIQFPEEFLHEMAYNALHFSTTIEGHGGDAWFYWDNLKLIYGTNGFLSLILFCLIFSAFFAKNKQLLKIYLAISVLLPYIFFTLATTKMNAFCVIVSPLVVILAIGQFQKLINHLFPVFELKYFNKFAPFIIILTALILIKPKTIIDNHYLNDTQRRKDYIGLSEKIINYNFPKNDQNIIVYGVDYFYHANILWMFHHDITAVNYQMSSTEVEKHKKMGRTVYYMETIPGDNKFNTQFVLHKM